jgi:general secretion pathway protein I
MSSRNHPHRVHAQTGFTLIEVVLAFSLLALGLAASMQIATGALRQAKHAHEFTEVSLYAQSLLDTTGVGERLEEGSQSGQFGERYHWQLDVRPYEVQTDTPLDPALSPVTLMRLDLTVSWERGRNTYEAHFSTLRALVPDTQGG